MTAAGSSPDVLIESARTAATALSDLEQLLRSLPDAHLHRADTEGGWTVAQTVSHIHLCGLIWIADLERLRHKQDSFQFREELGHDAVGAPPPSCAEAADRIASVRVAMEQCLPAADPAVLGKSIDINHARDQDRGRVDAGDNRPSRGALQPDPEDPPGEGRAAAG